MADCSKCWDVNILTLKLCRAKYWTGMICFSKCKLWYILQLDLHTHGKKKYYKCYDLSKMHVFRSFQWYIILFCESNTSKDMSHSTHHLCYHIFHVVFAVFAHFRCFRYIDLPHLQSAFKSPWLVDATLQRCKWLQVCNFRTIFVYEFNWINNNIHFRPYPTADVPDL